MKVGDLVRYENDAYPSKDIGVVIKIDHETDRTLSFAPYKILWTNHTNSTRDWFREAELVKL
jgi:hypothetical protein